jgi:hypothetical protein
LRGALPAGDVRRTSRLHPAPVEVVAVRVLFAVHDWGLGHATRDLPLIRALAGGGHEVTLISAGRALQLLRQEMGASCDYIERRDIPKPLSRQPFWFYLRMSLAMPWVLRLWRRDHRYAARLCRERGFQCIISDTRYGICLPDVPSYYVVHSLRQIIPGRPRRLEKLVECAQIHLLRGARKILVPDYAAGGLAGELCHDVACHWGNGNSWLDYIGILSSVARAPVEEDIDCFISVSGAEPQRSIFEEIVLSQVHDLSGRVVVALGKADEVPQTWDYGRITVHSYLNRSQQQEMMNRARMVVTRSGYTTLMELAELGKRALLIPTVGQSEQEYLARYHQRSGHWPTVHQSQLRLARDVARAAEYPGPPRAQPTAATVARFLALVG